MRITVTQNIMFWCLSVLSSTAFAEGIIDVKPYISTGLNYDDNVFRFSSPAQAKASFGSSATGDTVKRLDLGLNVNLTLSRQLVTLQTSLSESKYNRFDILDNTAKNYGLAWNWRLGDDVYGVFSTYKNESIAGFNEIRSPLRNIRTFDRQLASIFWTYHPDWTLYASAEAVDIDNGEQSFASLNREDSIFETGLRFQNTLNTQLALSYRINQSNYTDRIGVPLFFFGKESKQESIGISAAWLPTPKTRISTRLSQIKIQYKDKPIRDFDGLSQRWDVTHSLTGKVNLNASIYRDIMPIDDVESTYVKTTGISFNPVWSITEKVAFRAGILYEKRDYLGSSVFSFLNGNDRNDNSTAGSLGLVYKPTLKSLVLLQYQGEKRESSISNQNYSFNAVNINLRYDY